MTACTNNGGKARRVVTAALVGALSVGAVPTIALATGADVSLQAAEWFTGQEITAGTNGSNQSVEDVKNAKFTAGDGYLVPTKITDGDIDGSYTLTYDVSAADVTYGYDGLVDGWWYDYKTSKGTKTLKYSTGMSLSEEEAAAYFGEGLVVSNNPSQKVSVKPGTYTVSVHKDGEKGSVNADFEIVAASTSLDGAYAYVGTDPSNKEIVFNNTNLTKSDIKFADKNGNPLKVTGWRWYKADGTTFRGDDTAVTYAGNYFCDITTDDLKTARVSFTVAPLDLTTADVTYPDSKTGPANGSAFLSGLLVNGESAPIQGLLKIAETNNPDYGAKGTHKVTVAVDADAIDNLIENDSNRKGLEDSIKGSTTVTYAVLDSEVASAKTGTFKYGDYTLSNAELTIDLFSGQAFDSDKLALVGTDGKTYSGDQLEVTVDGDATVKGDYDVTVRVKPYKATDNKWYGGTKTLKLHVVGADLVADERLYFYLDGKLAGNGATVTYDAGNWLDRLEVVVKDADGNEIDPSNYEVKVTKGGEEVDSVTDAGTYKVQVTGKTFDFDSAVDSDFDLVVDPLEVDRVDVVPDLEANGTYYLTWTGEELKPTFKFFDHVDGEDVEVEVPAEAYDVTYYTTHPDKKDVVVKDEGSYVAYFDAAVDEKNYEFSSSAVANFIVTKKGVFLDVPTNEWYSQGVYDAAKLGYMNGEGGGKTFGPMRELTRAEAACVLFNMAGGDDMYPDATIPGYDVHEKVYDTDYTDVEGNEFFAKAIAWCKATGIINGYADGTFGVSRFVTNEEFACMLANYAKAKNEYKAVDADETLAAYPDASVVSDWAKDSVAWCVSEGIMGGGANISPAGSILRMRAATMAVNAQPEALSDLVIPVKPIQ